MGSKYERNSSYKTAESCVHVNVKRSSRSDQSIIEPSNGNNGTSYEMYFRFRTDSTSGTDDNTGLSLSEWAVGVALSSGALLHLDGDFRSRDLFGFRDQPTGTASDVYTRSTKIEPDEYVAGERSRSRTTVACCIPPSGHRDCVPRAHVRNVDNIYCLIYIYILNRRRPAKRNRYSRNFY